MKVKVKKSFCTGHWDGVMEYVVHRENYNPGSVLSESESAVFVKGGVQHRNLKCNIYWGLYADSYAEKSGLETMMHRPQGIKLSGENCRKDDARSHERASEAAENREASGAAQGPAKARLTNERPRPAPARQGRSGGR